MIKKWIYFLLMIMIPFIIAGCNDDSDKPKAFFTPPTLGEKLDSFTINRKHFDINSDQVEVVAEIIECFDASECYQYEECYSPSNCYSKGYIINLIEDRQYRMKTGTLKLNDTTYSTFYYDVFGKDYIYLVDKDDTLFAGLYYSYTSDQDNCFRHYYVSDSEADTASSTISAISNCSGSAASTFINIQEWFYNLIRTPNFSFTLNAYENYLVLETDIEDENTKTYFNRKTMKVDYEYRKDIGEDGTLIREVYCQRVESYDHILKQCQEKYLECVVKTNNWKNGQFR